MRQKILRIIEKSFVLRFCLRLYRILRYEVIAFITRLIARHKSDFLHKKMLAENPNDELLKRYLVSPLKILPRKRKKGISGLLTVAISLDLEITLADEVITRGLQFFDEIICVYDNNDLQPNLLAFCRKLEQRFPDRFLVYCYEPEVYPPGSREDEREVRKKVTIHTLGAQRNYALSKVSYQVVAKLDDDQFFLPSFLKQKDRIIEELESNPRKLLCISGLNIICSAGQLYIPMNEPFSGNGDYGLFNPTRGQYDFSFGRDTIISKNYQMFWGINHIHLKYLKKDFGRTHYRLKNNRDSQYLEKIDTIAKELKLVSLKEFAKNPNRYFPQFRKYDSLFDQQRGQALVDCINEIIGFEESLVKRTAVDLATDSFGLSF